MGCPFVRPLGANVKFAYRDSVVRLHQFYGFEKTDAYDLLEQVGEVRVHQTLGNWSAVLVKLDKKYLI